MGMTMPNPDDKMEQLKHLLNKECDRTLTSGEWDELFALCCPVRLKRFQVLINAGQLDSNIYIVKEGVMRGVDYNGGKERTLRFGLPGTIFNSRHSFYMELPSQYRIEACCPSVVLRVKRDDYIALTDASHRFAVWALHYAWWEQYLVENRESTVHRGNARERYLQMVKTLPLIIEKVPQRIVASYLDVSPEYLSRVKSEMLRSRQGCGCTPGCR